MNYFKKKGFEALVISGPTGSGKNKLANIIGNHIPIMVINADAIQVYKKWKILSGRPTDIEQKKIISSEEYKKKVTELRKKVSALQKERNTLLESVSKQRTKARNELLKNLNPIIKDYMNEKKIRMVVDKKSLLLADENLDITQDIIKILNS